MNIKESKKLITEAPDQYGLPTDDEIEAEERAEFEKRLADRKAQRDADFKKKDDERISKEKAEQRKVELKAKADEILKELGTNPDFKDAFDKLVPSSGPCESIGAELIRGVNRLEYRWWNDGDRFYDDYGLETCGSPAAFIYDNADEYGAETGEEIVSLLVKTAEKDGTDSDYDDFIDTLKEKIIKLVFEESPELLAEPLGKDDIHSWTSSPEDYWGSYVPTQEWEIEVSDKVKYYLDRGDTDSWAIVDYILNHVEDIVRSNSYTKKPSVNRPYTNADETYTVTNLSKDAYNELENTDTDEFWYDLEQDLEDEYGPVVYTEDLEDQCYERLENLKSEFESKGYSIDISDVSVNYDYGDYVCEFDLTVNGQYLGGVDFTFTITADEIDGDEFDTDAKTNIEDRIETDYDEPDNEESNESLKEKFSNSEFAEFQELCNKLDFTKLADVDKFAKEHNNVKDQELLQAMRDAVKDEKTESLKEEFTTIEDAFKSVNGNKEVFDKEGYFIDSTYEKYAQKVADKFFNGNIDELDKVCEEEHCFKESLKEDYNYDEDAFYQAYNNGDIYCNIVKDDDGDDFMIVDDYEEIQKIQKLLSPDFEPKDKYDTSVLDNFMSWGFSDSYSSCDNCGKLIGTEPDSKHWTPNFFVSDNGLICGDCVREDPSEYLQSLANNPDSANTILSESELEDAGFVKLDGDYQNGWYDRQDDPRSILNDLLDRFPNGVFIFNITAQAQFATNFDVWGEEGTFDEYDDYEDEETDESLKEGKEVKLPETVIFDASEVALDSDDEDPSEILSDLLSDEYGYCHFGFDYDVEKNEFGEPSKFICKNIKWDTSESLKESENSMADAVNKNTKNFTKEKGQMVCNKGSQQEDAESILKKHYFNVDSKPAKGGRISISFSGLIKNEALNENESDGIITKEELDALINHIYSDLEDNGVYLVDITGELDDEFTANIVFTFLNYKDLGIGQDMIEDIIENDGFIVPPWDDADGNVYVYVDGSSANNDYEVLHYNGIKKSVK